MKEWLEPKEFQKEYSPYIQSYEWEMKRLEALKFYGRACMACKGEKNLHVHHADYSNLKNEKMEDLRVLCKRCHKDLHKKYDRRNRGRLRDFTDQYIREKGKPPKKMHQKSVWIGGKRVANKRLDKKPKLSTGNSCVDDDYLI